MDSNGSQISPADDPASAFAELRREVSLLRRAVEGLTAERQNAPDYTPSLKAHSARLAQIEAHLSKVAESPAMRLTPESLAASIVKAGKTTRAGEREIIQKAGDSLQSSIGRINAVVEQAWTADRQNRWLIGVGLAGVLFGILMWSILAGEIARSLPTSWRVPEKMAARTLRLSLREGGEQMIRASASPTGQHPSKRAAKSTPSALPH